MYSSVKKITKLKGEICLVRNFPSKQQEQEDKSRTRRKKRKKVIFHLYFFDQVIFPSKIIIVSSFFHFIQNNIKNNSVKQFYFLFFCCYKTFLWLLLNIKSSKRTQSYGIQSCNKLFSIIFYFTKFCDCEWS